MKDYYYILGVKPTATPEEIKSAYRKLSLKFHPDKNGGDEFFTERFKDLQEAYETLSSPTQRAHFDNLRSRSSGQTYQNNFNPEVEFFTADRSSFEYNEEITFSWKTINSDKVILKPFGIVDPIGQKTYKIKNFKNPSLCFELLAENTRINRQVKYSLSLQNRTYAELYQHFKTIFEYEENLKKQRQQQAGSNSSNHYKTSPKLIQHKTDKGILEIPTCLSFKGQPAFMNGHPAPDGKYRIDIFTSIRVKDGIII